GGSVPPTSGGSYPPYTGAAPAGQKAPVLSIISLIAGIVGLLGFWVVFIPVAGGIMQLFIPAAAVVLGFLGKKKEPQAAKGLWLTGIVTGFIGLAIGLISIILWIVLIASFGTYSSDFYY